MDSEDCGMMVLILLVAYGYPGDLGLHMAWTWRYWIYVLVGLGDMVPLGSVCLGSVWIFKKKMMIA
jgi:hypothetical protein